MTGSNPELGETSAERELREETEETRRVNAFNDRLQTNSAYGRDLGSSAHPEGVFEMTFDTTMFDLQSVFELQERLANTFAVDGEVRTPSDGTYLLTFKTPITKEVAGIVGIWANDLRHGTDVKSEPVKSAHDKVLDFIAERNLNFLLGRAIEAICETDIKSDYYYLEDLRKAKNYIDREIQRITDNAAHH